MAAVFLVFAVILVLIAREVAADARLLAAEGVAASATVGDRTITETRRRDSDGFTRTRESHSVGLTFTTATGETVTVEKSVSRAQFDDLAEGEVVEIFYVPSNPVILGFSREEGQGGAGLFGWIGGLFGLIGLGFAYGGRAIGRRMAEAGR